MVHAGSDAGSAKHNVDAMEALERLVGRIEGEQGRDRHSKRYEYDCRHDRNHQYMSKDQDNAKFTCWRKETYPGRVRKTRRHAEHAHRPNGTAEHVGMADDTQ